MNVGTLDFLEKMLQTKNRNIMNTLIKNKKLNAPKVVELDLISACNYNCSFCLDKNIINDGCFFTLERMHSLIVEMKELGVQAVVLIGGGEPLMHPNFDEILKLFYLNDISIGLTTNGSLINKYIDSIEKYVSWIRVSVDAASAETHNYLKNPTFKDDFNNVIYNMKQLSKNYKGKLGFSFIVNDCNYNEIEKATILAKEINCSYIQFKAILCYDTKRIDFYNSNCKTEIINQLNTIKKYKSDDFNILISENLETILCNNDLYSTKYKDCFIQELRTLITPNGVYLCPYHRGNDLKKFGDIKNQSLKTIWESQERANVINQHNCRLDCNFNCIRDNLNNFLNATIELYDKGIDILPFLKDYEDISDNYKFI